MILWEALWTGVVAGLVASLIWFAAFRIVRPRVKIAPRAAWEPSSGVVRIKILNRARRDLVDIQFQLDVVRPLVDPKGISYALMRVRLLTEPPVILVGRSASGEDNAYRLGAQLDPLDVFSEDRSQFVRLRVFGRDSVSGVGRVAEARYHSLVDFVDGNYETGQKFQISPR